MASPVFHLGTSAEANRPGYLLGEALACCLDVEDVDQVVVAE